MFRKRSALVTSLGSLACLCVWGAPIRTQSIALRAGWNAVFLQVQPAETNPSRLFAGTPIQIAACLIPPKSTVQFIRDPREEPWNEPGWVVWYAATRPDAFLSTLVSVAAPRPYLVYSATAFAWQITGEVTFRRTEWVPNSFNFVGFDVAPDAPPTFAQFFAGSAAHRQQRFYQLVDGRWTLIAQPVTTPLTCGEAYWVYCSGASGWQGAMDVNPGHSERLWFADGMTERKLRITNTGVSPLRVTVQCSGTLPVFHSTTDVSTARTTTCRLGASLELPVLEPGNDTELNLQVDNRTSAGEELSALLLLAGDTGCRCWLPLVFSPSPSAASGQGQ